MGGFRGLLLSVLLWWVCLISACRTTESQLYSPVSVPLAPYTALAPGAEAPSRPVSAGSKIPFLLLTAAILAALILVFASDQKPKKRKAASPSRPRRHHKR